MRNRKEDGSRQRTIPQRAPAGIGAGTAFIFTAAALGYLYWDYAGRFQSTDDAFIAARAPWRLRSPATSPPSRSPTTSRLGAGGVVALLSSPQLPRTHT